MSYNIEKIWTTKAKYLAVCIAIKNMHRCGYVGLPADNPLYGIEYNQNTKILQKFWDKVKNGPVGKRGIIELFCASQEHKKNLHPSLLFNVHGGITYSGGDAYPLRKQYKKLWWFGFDCGHNGDGYFKGKMSAFMSGPIRSIEYVMAECESLAEQLKEVELSQIENQGQLPLNENINAAQGKQ